MADIETLPSRAGSGPLPGVSPYPLLLREMHRERGLTSIIATHNPRLAAACDRVLRLEDGKLRED